LHPLEMGAKNQNFLENMKSAAQFRLIEFIFANDSLFVYKSQVNSSAVRQ